jgi:hypothetical protein
MLVPLALLSKGAMTKNRVFLMYLLVGAIFYFVLFDFSQGALDKYLMYSIVPLAAIAGTVISGALSGSTRRELATGIAIGTVGTAILILLNFLSPQVMPLYPKTEWVTAIRSGNWNVLMPFTGGDGPIGFYVSFLVIAFGFGTSAVLAVIARYAQRARVSAVIALVVIGVAYNAVFIEELTVGRINGSAPQLLHTSLGYIADAHVKDVITHADAGAYELKGMGKYAGRFYAVPGYEDGHKALFSKFTGEYLVVDVPLLNDDGFYSKFFATCKTTFTASSGVIHAYVYDCAGSDPYAIK